MPIYLKLSERELASRIEQANEFLEFCRVCPRNCGANRMNNEKGFCCLGRKAVVFNNNPDFGEEKCLIGKFGSGSINFNFCNLSCAYCRSYEISQLERGRAVPGKEKTAKELAKIMLDLQKKKCHNINLINPTSQIPQILEALPIAIKGGLKIPFIYNTNAYDSVELLKLLDGIIDIYLPDFKYSDEKNAKKYSNVINYFFFAKKAIKEMYRQVGNLEIGADGLAKRGLLVRHLILPNNLAGSEQVLEFLAKKISPDLRVNIMNHYNPCWQAKNYPELNRQINEQEYEAVIDLAKKYGLNWFTE